MSSRTLLLALSVAALPAAARAGDAARPEGTIEIGNGRTEVLSKALPVGKTIELPEGWFRVEEEGPEDGRVGSFTIVSSSDGDADAPEPAPVTITMPEPALASGRPAPPAGPSARAAPPPGQACRTQRSAYLRQLWKESGIEVSDPEALLEGLDAGSAGPATGYYWFAMATDAFRNLAFSSDLRARAGDLVRCIQAARGG